MQIFSLGNVWLSINDHIYAIVQYGNKLFKNDTIHLHTRCFDLVESKLANFSPLKIKTNNICLFYSRKSFQIALSIDILRAGLKCIVAISRKCDQHQHHFPLYGRGLRSSPAARTSGQFSITRATRPSMYVFWSLFSCLNAGERERRRIE